MPPSLDSDSSGAEQDNPAARLRTELELASIASPGRSTDTERHLLQALEFGGRHSLVETLVQAGPAIIQLVDGFRPGEHHQVVASGSHVMKRRPERSASQRQ